MNPRLREVKPNDDYTLTLEFANGEHRLYDCKPILDFGIFKELKDLHYFKKVSVFNGTICWPNEQDIDPDTLYLDSEELVESALRK